MKPTPHSKLKAPHLVEQVMEKMTEKIVEKIQLLFGLRKSFILCIKSSQIFCFVLIQRRNLNFFIFGPFTKVATSTRQFTLKIQN